jgi:hypothetical protein
MIYFKIMAKISLMGLRKTTKHLVSRLRFESMIAQCGNMRATNYSIIIHEA